MKTKSPPIPDDKTVLVWSLSIAEKIFMGFVYTTLVVSTLFLFALLVYLVVE